MKKTLKTKLKEKLLINQNFKSIACLIMSMLISVLSCNIYTDNNLVHANLNYVKSNIFQILNPVESGQNDNWRGNYIYFGKYPQTSDASGGYNNDPIKWRVLNNNNAKYVGDTEISESSLAINNEFSFDVGPKDGTGGRQNAPVNGNAILLMSDALLDHGLYHPDYDGLDNASKLCWSTSMDNDEKKGSILWGWLNNINKNNVHNNREFKDNYYDTAFIDQAFTNNEQNVIMDTVVYTEDLYKLRAGEDKTFYESPVTTLSKDKIFVPSYSEMINTKYGFEESADSSKTRALTNTDYANSKNPDDYSNYFWLRSRGYYYNNANAALVNEYGSVFRNGANVNIYYLACSPALNLDQSSVILASNAVENGELGSKTDGVSSNLKKFELATGYNNEYKLTMTDNNHSNFKVANLPASLELEQNDNIQINYSGAQTGDNEYLSVILTQKAENAGYAYDETKYYGKIKALNSGDETGEATINLQNVDSGDYTLKIFNEQCNGDKVTDWASNTTDIELKVKDSSTPTPDSHEENSGIFNWNVLEYDINPTPTPSDQTGTIGTKTLRDIQNQLPEKVKTVGYIEGYGDGTFKPEKNITRAEAVQMIYKLIYNGTRVNYDALQKFNDVNQSEWYSTALAYLTEQGLIDGDGGKFYPNRQITRAEMSKILYNALLKYDRNQDKKLAYGTTQFNFTDIPNNWMLEPIKQLATNDMIDGYGDGTFKPNNNITRAESVTMIAKVFDRSQNFAQRINFSDVSQSHWAYKFIMNAVNGEE